MSAMNVIEENKPRWGKKGCRDGWLGSRGGLRGIAFMWAHREGDIGAESHSNDLAKGRQDVRGVLEESQGDHVPRAEQGVAWEEMRSLSESVFSGAGFILVNFSLSEMGNPWRVEQRRGRLCRVLTGSGF